MNNRKKEQLLISMNVIAVGCIATMIILFLIHYQGMKRFEENATILHEEMKTEENVEGFRKIEDLITYFNHALANQDIDSYLRGCAIEEKVENYPFSYMMSKSDTFSYEAALLPSASYKEYHDVNTILMADQFVKQYKDLWDNVLLKEDGTPIWNPRIMIKDTRILYPEEQMSEKNIEKQLKKAERWNAEFFVELGTRILINGDGYMVTFIVGRCDGYYKLFSLQSSMVSWDKSTIARPKTQEEFLAMTGDQDIVEFTSQMESLMVEDPEIGINEDERDEDREDQDMVNVEIEDAIENPEEAVPSLNYYVVDQLYGKNTEDVVEKFFLELFRNNSKKALNYCQIYEEGDSLEEVVVREADFSRQLSYLYKGLARLPYASNYYVGELPARMDRNEDGSINYEELTFERKDISYMLDPSLFYRISILEVNPVQDKENEILFTLSNYKKTYQCAFTTVETEKGWQIASMGSVTAYLRPGEVRSFE